MVAKGSVRFINMERVDYPEVPISLTSRSIIQCGECGGVALVPPDWLDASTVPNWGYLTNSVGPVSCIAHVKSARIVSFRMPPILSNSS